MLLSPEEYAEAEENGIKPAMLDRRIRAQGWTKECAMTTPPRGATDRRKWLQMALENGINKNKFYNRIRLGCEMEQAATKPLQTSEEIREQALRATERIRVLPKEYVQLALWCPSLDFRSDIFVLWKSRENETHSCKSGIGLGVPLLAFSDFLKAVVNYTLFLENKK
ncbi:hypothetical protein ACX12E_20870 [Paenibacillus vandeheii]